MLTPKETTSTTQSIFPTEIPHAAQFDGAQYLSRTPTASGDLTTWTFDGWYKGIISDSPHCFLTAGESDLYPRFQFFLSDSQFSVYQADAAGTIQFNYLFDHTIIVDPTAWYNLTLVVDTTNATAPDRVRVFYNGQRLTEASETVHAAQGVETWVNNTYTHHIGRVVWDVDGLFNGYVAQIRLVDGQAVDHPSGELSSNVSGLWKPMNISFDHGTNGFLLSFEDAMDMGHDSNGANHWSVTGSPVQVVDTPTNNFATLDKLSTANTGALSLGNLRMNDTSAAGHPTTTLVPRAGKWYVEITIEDWMNANAPQIGLAVPWESIQYNSLGFDDESYGVHLQQVQLGDSIGFHYGGAVVRTVSSSAGVSKGDTYALAIDHDAHKCWLRHPTDGWIGDPVAGTGAAFEDIATDMMPTAFGQMTALFNFGATGFSYALPSGYTPLCAANLPEPTVIRSSRVIDLFKRVGTGAETTIAGLEFSPDFVSIKATDAAYNWNIHDSGRGPTHQISTNLSNAQDSIAESVTAFNSTGYVLGSYNGTNEAGTTFLDLCFKAGPEQGFDVVTYTGDASGGYQEVSHSLGKIPAMIIVKNLSRVTQWTIYHVALGATIYSRFNTEVSAPYTGMWNDTEPTATHFTVGNNDQATNQNDDEYIAYLFADSDIFKAFSYVGNAANDGPFINLGGKLLSVPFMKNTDAAVYWRNVDSVRNPLNPIASSLYPNTGDIEATRDDFNFMSTGLKIKTTDSSVNGGGQLHIGLAILESTKYSNAY